MKVEGGDNGYWRWIVEARRFVRAEREEHGVGLERGSPGAQIMYTPTSKTPMCCDDTNRYSGATVVRRMRAQSV